MASHASGEGQLANTQTCSICIEPFKEPKLLPCFHAFCRRCLEQFTSKSVVNGKFFCPVCRFNVTLPHTGVKGFQTNFYIEAGQVKRDNEGAICEICSKTAVNRCQQCEQTLCEQCTSVHNTLSVTRSHSLVRLQETSKDYPAISKPEFCSKHKGELFRFHCRKCEKPICRDCKLTSHEGHETLDLEDVIEEGRMELSKLKVEFDRLVPAFERKLKQMDGKKKIFSTAADDIVNDINMTADRLILLVNETRKSKLDEIEMIKIAEVNHLDNIVAGLSQEKMFLQSHINHVTTLLTEGCGADVLNTLPDMKRRLTELTKPTAVAPKLNNPQVLRVSRTDETRPFNRMELSQIMMQVSEPEILNSQVKSTFQCTSESGTVDFICPVGKGQAWIGLRRTVGKCMLALFNEKGVMVKGFHVSKERYEGSRMDGILSLMHDGDEKGKSEEIIALEKDIKLKQKPLSDSRDEKTCKVDVLKRVVTVVNRSGDQEMAISALSLSSAASDFSPRDVCWGASNEHLIIADMGSNSLLHYKKNCDTLTCCAVKHNGEFRPVAVAFSQNGKLWIGEETGRVSILRCQ